MNHHHFPPSELRNQRLMGKWVMHFNDSMYDFPEDMKTSRDW
jgi:hypothetical protein